MSNENNPCLILFNIFQIFRKYMQWINIDDVSCNILNPLKLMNRSDSQRSFNLQRFIFIYGWPPSNDADDSSFYYYIETNRSYIEFLSFCPFRSLVSILSLGSVTEKKLSTETF